MDAVQKFAVGLRYKYRVNSTSVPIYKAATRLKLKLVKYYLCVLEI